MSEQAVAFPVCSGTLPWSRSCFVCGQDNAHGLRLKSRVEGNAVVLEHTTREADLGWRHLVHGGIVMTLLDEVMTWAAMLASERACVAAEMTTRLKRAVAAGVRLRVEGTVVEAGRKLVRARAQAFDPEGRLLAAARGKYVPMPGNGFEFCRDDFVADDACLGVLDILCRHSAASS